MAFVRWALAMVLLLACGSSESPGGAGGTAGGATSFSLTVDGATAQLTDALATFTGAPYNRLRVSARRGADPMLEEVQVAAAGDAPLHIGAYSCADQSDTGLFYSIGDQAFDDEGECTVTITKAVSGAGQEAAGTFSGVVTDGSARKTLSGSFRLPVMLSN
jgi:hypothetical protein